MKKIKYLQIQFKEEISADELPEFRGAVIAAATRENILFHNHIDENYRYAYPLIQYKRIGKRPTMICLEAGTEEIHAFFSRPNATLQLGEREMPCQIERLFLNEITLQTWEKTFTYQLDRWLALKDDNYRTYLALETETERKAFLSKMLVGNLLSLAKGLGWHVENPIIANVQHLLRERKITYKNTPLIAFDVTFSTNVFLPDYIGLGKSSAMGYGVVRRNSPLNPSERGTSNTLKNMKI